MKELKVALSTPVDDNLYSLLVAKLLLEENGIKIVGVITLKIWSFNRVFSEFSRLGVSILRKMWDKYIKREEKTSLNEDEEILKRLVRESKLNENSLQELCKTNEIRYKKVISPNDKDSINFLNQQNPNLIVSIGSVILKEEFIDIPSIGILNVHMGILPEYRGIGVTEWPIIEAESLEQIKLGITLHFIERGVDTGPIILKKPIPLKQDDSVSDLDIRYLPEMVKLMVSGITLVRDEELKSINQERNQGKQYYSLHHRMKTVAQKRLENLFSLKGS